MMDGSPDMYDERLMYNGAPAAGRYIHPSMAARWLYTHIYCLFTA